MKKNMQFVVLSMIFLLFVAFVNAESLPIVGSESQRDQHGNVLNNWLLVTHTENGTLKNNSVQDFMLNLTSITLADFTNDAGFLTVVGNPNIATGTITAGKLNLTDITLNDFANDAGYQKIADFAGAFNTNLSAKVGTDVQAFDAQLSDVAGLAVTDNNFIVGNGVNFVAESGATARTSLGLGSLSILSTVTASEITDGTILSADLSLGTGTGLDYDDFTTGTVADARIASTITRDTEWDTEAEVQTAWGAVNIILETEIDASSELVALMDDETGSGLLVFATSPTLVTPTLGAATATSVNKLTITAPTTSATLTIADSKTLTASNTLTLTGTDSSSVAFGAGGTVAYVANKLSVFAATTSAELAGVISDETGSGALVFANTPTLVTPALGAATATSINIGTGTTITKHLSATGAVDFAAITAPNCDTKTITVTNAAVGDTVVLGPPSTIEAGISSWSGFVSAANTVTIKACAVATSTDAASATWRADVWQH